MKHIINVFLHVFLLLALVGGAAFSALASPGAHGPNGEHLDSPAAANSVNLGGTTPRVEAVSELFELVGSLSGGELSVMIDRYDTNAPVLNGKLEVQYQDLKAQARFHADIGDYAFDDARLLAALSRPGKHALLFSFIADGDSDLLDGTLEVVTASQHQHRHTSRWWWLLAPLLAVAVYALVRKFSRRARHPLPRQEKSS